jgi:hypothetical protein
VARPDETRPDSRRLYWFVSIVLVMSILVVLLVLLIWFAMHVPRD